MNQDLKNIEDSLEGRIKQMEREMRKTSEQIDSEKTRYSRAMRRQSHLTNASEGSEQAISDAQHQYHIQYVKNVEYILGVISVFSLAIKCIKWDGYGCYALLYYDKNNLKFYYCVFVYVLL